MAYCANIDLLSKQLRETLLDCATIDHDEWSVVPSCGHDDLFILASDEQLGVKIAYTRHVLVTSRNRNVCIMSLSTCDSLDTVCNDFTCLKRKSHAITTHRDCIANTCFRYFLQRSTWLWLFIPTVLNCPMKMSSASCNKYMSMTRNLHPSIPCFETASLTIFPRSCTSSC